MSNNEEELPLCECGKCSLRVTKPGNRFIHGHNRRGKSHTPEDRNRMRDAHTNVPLSPAHCDAMSVASRNSDAVKAKNEAQKGVQLPPEHSAAISKAHKESDANKAQIESMRGGNDIVNHHYIYDHNDLSLNTVQMTRSDHQKLHKLFQKLGYIMPHINATK